MMGCLIIMWMALVAILHIVTANDNRP